MMRKLVREVARKHGLTHAKTFDMLVDFLESLIETDKIVTQDLIDYFEEEIVEAAKSGEFDIPISQGVLPPVRLPVLPPVLPPAQYDVLSADTKEIIKFLLENQIRVDSPVDIKFIGDKKAVIALVSSGYWKAQVALVRRLHGKLVYITVNRDSPLATVE